MILWFSGTGNSRQVARWLAAELGEQRLRELTPELREATILLDSTEQRVIWVFPVYSWGVPPYVLGIIRKVALRSPVPVEHHLVMTCGDDCGMADRMWRRAVKARGWIDGSAFTVQMPNNYVGMKGFDVDSAEVETAKLSEAPRRVAEVARAIEKAELGRSRVTDVVRGRFPCLKTGVIYPWFVRHAIDPRKFRFTDSCIGCGACARACPLGNITITDGHPRWGDDCAGCLGCYHACPVHAVAWGKATGDKGQYYLTTD